MKRLIDVSLALLLGFILSPVILLIAAAIRLTSPGPALFRQERVGLGSRTFRMVKFRTMEHGAEAEDETAGLGVRGDPRVTGLGRHLRRSGLDELPQFWNVLRGEMSLVGPRPERTFHARRFQEELDDYTIRYRVRPGVTGWAQVNGWRGDTSLQERVRFDLEYVRQQSIALDLRIILRTLVLLMDPRGSIGVSDSGSRRGAESE